MVTSTIIVKVGEGVVEERNIIRSNMSRDSYKNNGALVFRMVI